MRALKFKIKVDELVLRDYLDYHREDLEYVIDLVRKNHLLWNMRNENMHITGKNQYMYNFLYDLAYRYDIELM